MHPGYFPVFFWSLLILVSFWGYGELLRRRINRPEFADIGWGLTCAWGMSVVLALGGVLMALHQAKAPNLTALVLFGAVAAVFYLAEKITAKDTKSTKGNSGKPKSACSSRFQLPAFSFSVFLLYLLALLTFASSIAWPFQIDPNDDLICYLMLPEKILQTGTLIEPFNLRRAGTLGGHAFLQAVVMLVGGDRSGHVADLGLGRLVLFGVVLGLVPGQGRWPLIQRVAVGLFVLFYPVPRINTMSAYTGSALLLALMQTLVLSREKGELRPLAWWLPSGLLCAGCATLRPQFGLMAGMIFAVGWVAAWIDRRPVNSTKLVRSAPVLLIPAVLAAPWMLVLFQSNETIYFPPWIGNVNPTFFTTANRETSGIIGVLLRCFGRLEVLPLVLFSGLVFFSPRPFLGGAFMLSSVLCGAAVASKMSATTPVEMPRYLVPMLFPAALYVLCTASRGRRMPAVISGGACLAAVAANGQVSWEDARMRVASIPAQITSGAPLHPEDLARPGTYVEGLRALQSKIPSGRKILAVVDFPYLLDFARNDIVSIDAIGAAGPRGGVPLLQGANVLNSYFHDLGVEYVIMMDFDRAQLLYNRSYWKNHPRPEGFYKTVWMPRFLDFMGSMDDLWLIGKPLGDFYNLRAMRLPPPP